MESINDIIVKLQSFSPYQNMTAYQIKSHIGKPYELKLARKAELLAELYTLEQRISNSFVQLPKEMLYTILLENDYQDILSICKINIAYNKICNDSNFWKLKFRKDYPDLDIKVETLKEFIKFNKAYENALFLINNIDGKTHFYFKVDHTMTWLPSDLLDKVMTDKMQENPYQLAIFYFDINHYWITPAFATYPRNKNNIDLTKKETILYITKLFYYNSPKWELLQGC